MLVITENCVVQFKKLYGIKITTTLIYHKIISIINPSTPTTVFCSLVSHLLRAMYSIYYQ